MHLQNIKVVYIAKASHKRFTVCRPIRVSKAPRKVLSLFERVVFGFHVLVAVVEFGATRDRDINSSAECCIGGQEQTNQSTLFNRTEST